MRLASLFLAGTSSGMERSINPDQAFTDPNLANKVNTGWKLQPNANGGYLLCVLCTGTSHHTIIGGPGPDGSGTRRPGQQLAPSKPSHVAVNSFSLVPKENPVDVDGIGEVRDVLDGEDDGLGEIRIVRGFDERVVRASSFWESV